jgi:hypothetical protein|tara:strand:+ start:1086 stop:1397 length:312 start_codon:yes stop_codon:yes gene_type:complete
MGKLLETRLPIAQGDMVSIDTFNRLVRVLELNLSAHDPDRIKHYTSTEISGLQFATGQIIFNSTVEVHQAFDGDEFRNLYEHKTYITGLSATMSIGAVTVTIS